MKVKGIVMEGNKKAREIGFPTANIPNIAKVPTGIFAARILIEGKLYTGAAYVGTPQKHVLEAHIFDFDADLYGKEITVEVLEKIREDVHETDISKLKTMIAKDIEQIKLCLQE